MKRVRIGVDVGGTNVKIVALGEMDAPGGPHILERVDGPTRGWRDRDAVLADVTTSFEGVRASVEARGARVVTVGVGLPAALHDGVPTVMPNFGPGWLGHDVAADLGERWQLPVTVVNDARAFVVAEASMGAGRGHDPVLGVVLGTGVGGGWVSRGAPWGGHGGLAGELGHVVVDPHGLPCGCGGVGCLETIASGPAIVAAALRGWWQGRTPALRELCEGDVERVDASLVAEAARRGDVDCAAALDHAARALGMTLASACVLIAPSLIVVGGGILGAWDRMGPTVSDAFDRHTHVFVASRPQIVPALLGADAGALGAALAAQGNHGGDAVGPIDPST